MPELWQLALVAAASVVAGFVNTLAGAGGLVTMPTLLAIGLPAPVANASLRVGIVIQCATAAHGLAQRGHRLDHSWTRWLVIAVIAGGSGALLASHIDADVLWWLVIIACGLAATSLLFPPPLGRGAGPRPWVAGAAIAFAGFYGGLVQTGVGLLLLAAADRWISRDVRAANVFKLWATGLFNLVAAAVFAAQGLVNWPIAAAVALGSMIGASVGVRYVSTVPERPLRIAIAGLGFIAIIVLVVRGP